MKTRLPTRFTLALGIVIIVFGIGARQTFASSSVGTAVTPEARPSLGGWPIDVNGDGVISDTGNERIPELIRAVGDNGVQGYVRLQDLDGPEPSSPEEAVAISGQDRVIPVYEADGVTIVDQYTLHGSATDQVVSNPTPAKS